MATVSMDEHLRVGAREPESPYREHAPGGGGSLPHERANREDLFCEFGEKFMEYDNFFRAAACALVAPCASRVSRTERPENEEILFLRANEIPPHEKFPPQSHPAAGLRARTARMKHRRSRQALMECTQ